MQPDPMSAVPRRSNPSLESHQDGPAEPQDAEPLPERAAKVGPRLERRVDGKLWLLRDGAAVAVDVVRCFPWSEPRRFLSLRSADGEEQAFVRDLEELEPKSRAVLAQTLRRASFVIDVTEILHVEEDFELRSWKVRAAHGVRTFQTALDTWPQELPDGALLLEDVYGDLYRIPSPDALDAKSRKLLWAYVD